MSEREAVSVVRRSPGRLRVHASFLSVPGGKHMERIAAVGGVRDVRCSPRTGNVLIEFDQALITEKKLLALIEDEPASAHRTPKTRITRDEAKTVAEAGWLHAERSETIHARAADCITALLDFERYPEWQTYVTAASVHERDERGRGVRVRTRAKVPEREIDFTTSYRFPSPNRIVFEQDDGELGVLRGSWAFRSSGGGRTRATCVLEVKPGWRLSLLLHASLLDRIREAVLDHLMGELRARVEDERVSNDNRATLSGDQVGLVEHRARKPRPVR
jgi:ribosome-associated toxin RatA of RatAB toxin-antitoxin module